MQLEGYHTLFPIDTGAAARVYAVLSLQSKKTFALKRSFRTDLARKQCLHEWEIYSLITPHQNIIKYYQCIQDKNYVYLLQDLASNDLYGALEFDKREVMRGIFLGLQHLKRCQIIHSDIKRENIVLYNGVPKIIDFGYSVQSHNETYQDTVYETTVGTLTYLTHEVLTSRLYTFSQDMHAAGVILYELLTGYNPYDDGSPTNTRDNILRNRRLYDDSLPPAESQAEDLIDQCIGLRGFILTWNKRYTPEQALAHSYLK